jgi:beta-glucosidase
VWTGFLVPPESGTYRLGLSGFNGELKIDGKPFADLRKAGWGSLPTLKTLRLEKGKRYPVEITSESHALSGVSLVWKRIATDPAAELKAATAKADVLVAVVGLTSDMEAEEAPIEIPGFKGGDKTTLDLPADQQALLAQARALGKPLIVVAMNGSPLNFSWAKDNASALLEAWYPGQSGGLAIANVLTGKANPAGRLPLTFYRSTDDLPSFDDYAMTGRTYRYFEGTPVYPFGYGLSYTRFDYGPLKLEPSAKGAGQGLRVTTTIKNAGARQGEDVAQVYLNFPETPGAPRLALRGFQRISLKPGETREVTFALSPRDLSSLSRQCRFRSARHGRPRPLGGVRGRYVRGGGQITPPPLAFSR